jgi:branched-chain amino acid aminotransferase
MAEECYFFLMASMRKMRMNIPLSFTLEFFSEIFKSNSEKNSRRSDRTFGL